MAEGRKQAVITVDVETGEVVSVEPKNGAEISGVLPQEIDQAYRSATGLKFVGLVLHIHSSPGCVYWINGIPIKVC
jgi:hypothetical protein